MVQICNPSYQEIKAGRSEIILDYTEFEANLEYMRPNLRKNLEGGGKTILKLKFVEKWLRSKSDPQNELKPLHKKKRKGERQRDTENTRV